MRYAACSELRTFSSAGVPHSQDLDRLRFMVDHVVKVVADPTEQKTTKSLDSRMGDGFSGIQKSGNEIERRLEIVR